MRTKPIVARLPRLFAGLLLSAFPAMAQSTATTTAPADPALDEPIELSPFVVEDSANVGYAATSTLAGTRIKTNLRDLGAAISVVTPQFMQDTGATNVEELFAYTLNTEIGGAQGNYSAVDLSQTTPDVETAQRQPQLGARVRGLQAPNFTRGYFSTSIPVDAYNMSGLTISRGANSLLFGLGSAGGVVDTGLSAALLGKKDERKVELRFDHLGSYRGTFSASQTVLPGRLAVNVATLYKQDNYEQDPAYDHERRVFGSFQGVVLKNQKSRIVGPTIIRGSIEAGEGSRNPPSPLTPMMFWEPFFNPPFDFRPYNGRDYGSGGYAARLASYRKWATVDTRRRLNPNGTDSPGVFSAGQSTPAILDRQVALIFAGPGEPDVGIAGMPLDGFQGAIPGNPSGTRNEFRGTTYYAANPNGLGFRVPHLTDRSIFDYKKKLFSGNLQRIDRKFDAQNLALEQQFLEGRGGIELALGREYYRQDFRQPFANGGGAMQTPIDVTEYIHDSIPNPNVGRVYTKIQSNKLTWRSTGRHNERATAFYDLNLKDHGDRLGKWLGRHRFTGLYQRESETNKGMNYDFYWQPVGFDYARVIQNTASSDAINNRLLVIQLAYLSPDMRGKEQSELRLNRLDVVPPNEGGRYTMLYYDYPAKQFKTGEFEVVKLANGATARRTDVTSRAFAWQSYLLDGHLVGLAGWREDDIRTFLPGPTLRAPNNSVLEETINTISGTPNSTQAGETFTWSMVGHAPAKLVRRLPDFVSSLSVHVSSGENFSAIAERHDIYGSTIPSPSGTTKEYGVTFGFQNDKWSLRLNRYETASAHAGALATATNSAITSFTRWLNNYQAAADTAEPIAGTGFATAGYSSWDGVLNAIHNLVPEPTKSLLGLERSGTGGSWQLSPTSAFRDGLASTSDIVATGYELELTANPRPNWRIAFNVAKNETVKSNSGTPLFQFSEAVLANMANARLTNLPDGINTSDTFYSWWSKQVLLTLQSERAKDGTVSQEFRKWRANLVSTYEFREGLLRGFGVGGGVRWQSKVTTGYGLYVNELNDPVQDLSRPFFGPDELNGDLWLSYTRRLGQKIRWKVQLNARNIVGSQDDIPIFTNPDGTHAMYRVAPTRLFMLTNTFQF